MKRLEQSLKSVFFVLAMFAFLFFSEKAFADTWAKVSEAGYDRFDCIQQTTDNGYIIAGQIPSFGGDILVLKLDSSGNIQWQKTYGGYHQEHVKAIQQTSDGGYIILGDTGSFGCGGSGGYNALILKLDSIGNIQWQKSYDHVQCEWYGCVCMYSIVSYIQQTTDGGYIISGGANIQGDGQGLVLKLDASGNIEWRKAYPLVNYARHWWYAGTSLPSIQQTPDGGYIAYGSIDETPIYDYDEDAWLLKLDLSGDIQWQKRIDLGLENRGPSSIRVTSDGGYIVARGVANGRVLVLKFDSGGAIEWQKIYDNKNGGSSITMQQTADGGYLLSGYKLFNARWISKLDSDGNIQWQRTTPAAFLIPTFQTAEQTIDGGYIAIGSRIGYVGSENLVLKLDSNGRIPDCSVISDTPNATVINANATIKDTNVIAQDINILPHTSNAVVADANVTSRVLCMQTNQPPVANAGSDQILSCAGSNGAAVTLDGSGSSDPDGDALTYTWTGVFGAATGVNPVVQMPLGTNTVTLKVDDGKGETAEDTVTITVQDSVPPSTSATITGTLGNNGWYKSDVNVSLTSTDNCSGVKEIHYLLDGAETIISGSTAGFTISADGTHRLSFWAVDNANNTEIAHPATINIDKTAPVLNITVTPGLLWPPNHKMVNITPLINVSDNLTGNVQVELISVTSSEPDNGLGDGDTANDIVVNADGTISLRAERSGTGNGRVYTITYKATDLAGNVTVSSATAIVPHDMGK